MITLSYQGAGDYNVYLGNKMIQLTQVELESICVSVLDDTEHFEIPTRDKVLEDNETLHETLSELQSKISDHIGNIEELMDDEETEPIHLIRELEAIKKVIEESE